MKKTLIASFAVIFFGSILYGQETEDLKPSEEMVEVDSKEEKVAIDRSLYPEVGDFGIAVNVSGLIGNISALPRQDLLNNNSLFFRYNYSEVVTFRLGVAPQINRHRSLSTDSVGKDLVEFDSTASQANISLRPGVEFHIKGTKRLDPYIALDAELGLVGKMNIGSVSNTTDTTGTSRVVRTITQDGGYTLGGKLSLGMNYYIAPKLMLGLEYGLGVTSLISGGDRQEVIQIEPVSGTNTTIRELSSARTNDLSFNVDPMVQLTLGYFFGF